TLNGSKRNWVSHCFTAPHGVCHSLLKAAVSAISFVRYCRTSTRPLRISAKSKLADVVEYALASFHQLVMNLFLQVCVMFGYNIQASNWTSTPWLPVNRLKHS